VPQDLEKAKRTIKLAFDNPNSDDAMRRKCEALWNKYKLFDY
jgi:hypothetical protein